MQLNIFDIKHLYMNGYLYCEKRNTLFCHIEKSGCESLRYLLLKEEHIENPQSLWEIDGKYIYNSKNLFKLKNKNPNVIMIVRNPFARCVSGYIDKICSDCFNGLQFSKNVFEHYNNNIDERVSFEELIMYINTMTDKHTVDHHFRPMSSWLEDIKIFDNVSIFKMETIDEINLKLKQLNFENKFENYNKLFNWTFDRQHIENAHKLYYNQFNIAEKNNDKLTRTINNIECSTTKGLTYNGCVIPDCKSFYNEELKNIIYNYYMDDFINFEYDKDILN